MGGLIMMNQAEVGTVQLLQPHQRQTQVYGVPRKNIYLPKDNRKCFVLHFNAHKYAGVVPKWFVRRWPHAFTPNVKLQDPAKRIYTADVSRISSRHVVLLFLDAVKDSYSFNQTVLIRFQYIMDNFFKIRIYDVNEVEINYPPAPPFVGQVGVLVDVFGHDDEPAHVDNGLPPPALWQAKLSDADASGKQGLPIPANIVVNNFAGKPDTLQVIVPDGPAQSWNLLWDTDGCCRFGEGWDQYCRSAPFVPGDLLFFRVAQDRNTLILTINDDAY